MSGAPGEPVPTKLGDFLDSGQSSLAFTDHLPTRDLPDPPGWERTQGAGAGAVVAWLSQGVIIEIQAVRRPGGREYELLRTERGRTEHVAAYADEERALAAAAEHMEAGAP